MLSRLVPILLVSGLVSPAGAQRAPGAPDAADLRARIAQVQAQRSALRSEAERKEREADELEQRLERTRRELHVLRLDLQAAERQIRELEQALAQVR